MSKGKNVLVIIGHPYDKESVFNNAVVDELKKLLPEADFDYLIKEYPDYKFNVEKEQKRVSAADTIIFQYPIFWFGWPAIIQKWIEDVYLHGWAYGSKGKAVVGKKAIFGFSSGEPKENFAACSASKFTAKQLFEPTPEIFAGFTQMKFLGVVYSDGIGYELRTKPEKKNELLKKAKEHANKLVALIK